MKITIVSLGSCGDVYPSIALGRGFKDIGFQVRLAANTLFEPAARRQGLDFFPISVLYRQSLAINPTILYPAKPLDPFRFLTLKKSHIEPVMENIVKDIRHALQDADLVLYNMLGLPAYYLAKQMGIKSYPICLQPLGKTKEFPSPVIFSNIQVPRVLYSASYWIVEKCMDFFLSNIRQFKGKISSRDCFQEIHTYNIPVLHGFSPYIIPKPADWSTNMHITGYWFLDSPEDWAPPDDLKDFMNNGPAPVCVGFGSMNDPDIKTVIERAVKGILNAGQRVVLLTGWSGADFEKLSSSDLYVAKNIPHSWLFPKMSAVVHHGGAGTTAAAVRAGVPSIIIPFFFDQCFWADRLVHLGVGPPPILKKKLSQNRVSSAVLSVLENGMILENLKRLSSQVNSEQGVKNAVNLVLKEI